MKRGQNFDGPGCQKSLFSTFFEKSGDHFFDPKPLSIALPVRVPEFFEVTFDRFLFRVAKMVQNGPKLPNMVKKCQRIKKKLEKYFSKVGGMGPKAFKIFLGRFWTLTLKIHCGGELLGL